MAPFSRPAPVRGAASLPPVQVVYYRRLKFQRVYPIVVRWPKGTGPIAGQKLTVRLVAPGAQVVPEEQTLDAGKPNDQATFHVTPLARGWLAGQRLEILQDGRKVQELPLGSRAVTHRLTWSLLALTFIVPWLINSYVKHSPYREIELINARTGAKMHKINAQVAEAFDWYVSENVPAMPELINDYVPSANDALVAARQETADIYGALVNASQTEPYAFYGGLVMAGLTLAAALLRRDVRRKRIGAPIPLASVAVKREEELAVATA
jgi:hypothetical protein